MADSPGGKTAGKCAVCRKPVEARYRPFCSPRCQQIDLGRWLNENYRIATDQDPATPGSDHDDEAG
ncbi:MAG TPA: DNA gyrase inhibitor YacG [Dongiaceae bacterium]|nr:DNA gyrase inhibitor YacG [Dongiaceae bacterium]